MRKAEIDALLDEQGNKYPSVQIHIDGNTLRSHSCRSRRENFNRIVKALAALWDMPEEWILSEAEPHTSESEFSVYRDDVEYVFYKLTG